VDGKAIRAVGLELGSNSLDCLQWAIEVVFYDGDGGEDSLHVFYRQRTDVCDDPTGIYDYDPASSAFCGDPALVPPSITVV
jgi:hypothetical protein